MASASVRLGSCGGVTSALGPGRDGTPLRRQVVRLQCSARRVALVHILGAFSAPVNTFERRLFLMIACPIDNRWLAHVGFPLTVCYSYADRHRSGAVGTARMGIA